MLTDEQIKRYQELYKKRYRKDISREEALRQGIKLVQMVRTVYVQKSETSKEVNYQTN